MGVIKTRQYELKSCTLFGLFSLNLFASFTGFLEKPNVPPLTKEICYKVFVYGSAAVGKTSLVKFLNNENCSDAYHETNGNKVFTIS